MSKYLVAKLTELHGEAHILVWGGGGGVGKEDAEVGRGQALRSGMALTALLRVGFHSMNKRKALKNFTGRGDDNSSSMHPSR